MSKNRHGIFVTPELALEEEGQTKTAEVDERWAMLDPLASTSFPDPYRRMQRPFPVNGSLRAGNERAEDEELRPWTEVEQQWDEMRQSSTTRKTTGVAVGLLATFCYLVAVAFWVFR